ncbi:hypothetical protein OSTOST_18895, partial [Ostertagia ostertagi]
MNKKGCISKKASSVHPPNQSKVQSPYFDMPTARRPTPIRVVVSKRQAKQENPIKSSSEATLAAGDDANRMSSNELLIAIQKRNKDPVIGKMIEALISKIPVEIADGIEAEKRGRSIILSGLPEAAVYRPPGSSAADDERLVEVLIGTFAIWKPFDDLRGVAKWHGLHGRGIGEFMNPVGRAVADRHQVIANAPDHSEVRGWIRVTGAGVRGINKKSDVSCEVSAAATASIVYSGAQAQFIWLVLTEWYRME